MNQTSFALLWKLRRIAAGMRILDLYRETGISLTRLSEIERSRRDPSELETRLIEQALPPLPFVALSRKAGRDHELLSG